MNINIVNCHTHIFNLDNIPINYLPFGLTYGLKYLPFYKTLARILQSTERVIPRNRLARYGNFLELGITTQKEIFENICSYYPKNTKFIVLPMDLNYMGAGRSKQSVLNQHLELLELAKNNSNVIPFIAVDPRRQSVDKQNVLDFVKLLLNEKDVTGISYFKGIKLYPSQGFLPTDPILDPLYDFCQTNNLPIMTHCTRGGIKPRNMDKELATSYADPYHFIPILRKYPKLKVCLAHFGGFSDWDMYFEKSESRTEYDFDDLENHQKMNWLTKILQMIRSNEFPNLYTDISYTIFSGSKFMTVLKVLLYDDLVRSKTLFGSDYYMVEIEKFNERLLSIKLRAELGDQVYREIAEQNPKKYLGL